ncbi:MAG: prolipoprotein diacylglyceryl transferase [Acholeplasmataceae bacterium]
MHPYLEFGSFRIETYDVLVTLGFLLAIIAILIINRKHELYRLPVKEILFLLLFVVIGALIGARLLFIVTNIDRMVEDPSSISRIVFSGGLVFYGGVIGGLVSGYFYVKRYGLDPVKYMNLFIVALPLGHGCGRIGCYMAGCCHGKPTDSAFGVVFPYSESHPFHGVKIHPTQLYEATFNFLLFLGLLFLFFKWRKRHESYVFVALYLILYGTFRFINEFFRGDAIRGVYILSTSQWVSLIAVIAGLLLLVHKTDKRSDGIDEKRSKQ